MKRKLFQIFIFFFLCIIVIISIIFFFVLPTPADFTQLESKRLPILIAHSGGVVDGLTYTNSAEAVSQSLQNGYDFIELDLIETSDQKIGAAHYIEYFNKITRFENNNNSLTSKEFKSRKIHGTMHPLLTEDINKIFTGSKAYLVTDKIDNFKLINKEFTFNKDQILVETFSYQDYVRALNEGIKYPMLSIGPYRNLRKYWPLILTKKIKIITISVLMLKLYKEDIQYLHDKGIIIFVWTSNDKDFILNYGGVTVSGFYTDSITYNDLYK